METFEDPDNVKASFVVHSLKEITARSNFVLATYIQSTLFSNFRKLFSDIWIIFEASIIPRLHSCFDQFYVHI